MIRPNENALTPASLATDGNQGEGAKALGLCEVEHSPLALALSAIDAAREQLARYALATDEPAPGVIDAADCIDAATLVLSAELNRERKFAGGSA
jgi:hypothetical protein